MTKRPFRFHGEFRIAWNSSGAAYSQQTTQAVNGAACAFDEALMFPYQTEICVFYKKKSIYLYRKWISWIISSDSKEESSIYNRWMSIQCWMKFGTHAIWSCRLLHSIRNVMNSRNAELSLYRTLNTKLKPSNRQANGEKKSGQSCLHWSEISVFQVLGGFHFHIISH